MSDWPTEGPEYEAMCAEEDVLIARGEAEADRLNVAGLPDPSGP